MDLLSLVLSCSISTAIDDRLIASIIDEESFGNPYYVRLEGQQYGVGYETLQAAIAAIERVKKDGKGIYIGLMGVPFNEENSAASDLKTLFIECNNIAIGTGIIDLLIDQCNTEGRRDKVTCSIKKYGQKTDRKPTQFVEKVLHKSALVSAKKPEKTPNAAQIFVNLNDPNDSGNGVYLDYEKSGHVPQSEIPKLEKRDSN